MELGAALERLPKDLTAVLKVAAWGGHRRTEV